MPDKVKVSCLHCGATNNYPIEITGKKVICGQCKNPLPEPGMVVEPSPEQASSLIQRMRLPILVDFYSPTCAPCHMMHTVVENLAQRRAGELMVVKINVDHNPQIAAQFGVQSVPTFVVLYRGNERGRTVGVQAEADFALWVASKI
ncbi:MAG: thioredoxin fold domain-containing protein [Candidatus Aminicenantes bacterium]|nr:MAG: thioredoxin fold domain-containing protein [Candidatus Aminicenantes bacterium]